MKWNAFFILICITLGVMAPPMFPHINDHGATAEIGTLDVCHAVTPALSSNGDMLWMNEYAGPHLLPADSRNADVTVLLFKSPLISSQDERPPEV